MSPHPRTPQQRDRRFARVRRLTRTIFLGSGVLSGALVGFAASNAKPVVVIHSPAPTTTAPTTTTTVAGDDSGDGSITPAPTTTPSSTPTTVPVTTTTVCTTTPSGHTTCY